jgi:hypothetical protein
MPADYLLIGFLKVLGSQSIFKDLYVKARVDIQFLSGLKFGLM